MKYLFPFSQVPISSAIVLYGASDVGYDFYRQIKNSGYVNLVAWIDRNYEMYRMLDMPVDPPEEIKNLTYDYIVVSVLEERSYLSIQQSLMEQGVQDDIIIWSPNAEVGFDIAKKYTLENAISDAEDAVRINPIELVNEDRYDVVVRVLFAREILNNIYNGIGKKLYEKMFEVMNNAVEPIDHFLFRYFSDYSEKRGINAFEESFVKLIYSIKEDGYRKDGFIPLNKKGQMINGAHRCAAALAVGTDVWVCYYPIEGVKSADHHFTEEWFKDNGFSSDEIDTIKIAYNDIVNSDI